VIFIGASGNDSVVAVGADDGAVLWRSAAEQGYVDSTPAQSPDDLWLAVSDDSGYVHLLSALDGAEAWEVTFSAGVPVYSSPSFSADGGTIYFGSDDTHLYAVARLATTTWRMRGSRLSTTPRSHRHPHAPLRHLERRRRAALVVRDRCRGPVDGDRRAGRRDRLRLVGLLHHLARVEVR
jgi:Tol biopolymer transport system component